MDADQTSASPADEEAVTLTRQGIVRGFRLSVPLALGNVAFGAVFGVLARTSGMTDTATMLMSVIVYSGTAQMLALDLHAADAPILAIWGGTTLVSLRYLLLGMTTRDWFTGLPGWIVYPTLALTVDQSWAFSHAEWRKGRHDAGFFVGSNVVNFIGWSGGTLVGLTAGEAIPDPDRLRLDFAVTAAFIGILAGTWRGRPDLLPWVVAGGTALLAERSLGGHWYLLVGAGAGSIVGTIGALRRGT